MQNVISDHLGRLKLLNSTFDLSVEFNSVEFNKLSLSKGKIYLHAFFIRTSEFWPSLIVLKFFEISASLVLNPIQSREEGGGGAESAPQRFFSS